MGLERTQHEPHTCLTRRETRVLVRGTPHMYGGRWNFKGCDVRGAHRWLTRIGNSFAEVRFSLTAKVRLRKLEGEAFPVAELVDLVKIWRSAAFEVEQTERDF